MGLLNSLNLLNRNFPTKTLTSKQSTFTHSAHTTFSADNVIGTAECVDILSTHFLFQIRLYRSGIKAVLLHFCALHAYCLLQMNTSSWAHCYYIFQIAIFHDSFPLSKLVRLRYNTVLYIMNINKPTTSQTSGPRCLKLCTDSDNATRPLSSHGWHTPPVHGKVSSRHLFASTSTQWSTALAITDTACWICCRSMKTMQTTNFSARLCVSRATSCMHCPLHRNVTICENGHIRCSCLNITWQTVLSSHACSIKTYIVVCWTMSLLCHSYTLCNWNRDNILLHYTRGVQKVRSLT